LPVVIYAIEDATALRPCVTFVLDNSVAMRWCFEEAVHPYAESILHRLESGDDAVVPAIWLYEASAVLSRAQNRGTLAAQKAEEFADEIVSRAAYRGKPL
jgi:hypothetical protein